PAGCCGRATAVAGLAERPRVSPPGALSSRGSGLAQPTISPGVPSPMPYQQPLGLLSREGRLCPPGGPSIDAEEGDLETAWSTITGLSEEDRAGWRELASHRSE